MRSFILINRKGVLSTKHQDLKLFTTIVNGLFPSEAEIALLKSLIIHQGVV